MLRYAPTVFSNLFRIACYIFLRVIPVRLAQVILPTLLALQITSLWFSREEKSHPANEKRDGASQRSQPSSNTIRAVALSLPGSKNAHLLTVAVNVCLFLLAAEFATSPLFHPASDVIFTRLGAVYPDAVKIVVRHPQVESVQIIWREQQIDGVHKNWVEGPVLSLSSEHDWVNTTKLEGLWPSTSYEYKLAAADKIIMSYPSTSIQFRTFPDSRLATGSHFRFVASSCVTPNFPYVPLRGQTIRGFDLLANYLWPATQGGCTTSQAPAELEDQSNNTKITESVEHLPPVEFLMFLGDFVYADVPMYFEETKEAFRRLYRRNYISPSFRKIYERLPMFHIYDDHEISNNFAGQSNDSTPPFPSASEAYRLYNAQANYDSPDEGQFFYQFRHADAAFFVMDTRRYRSDPSTEDPQARTMLGESQLIAFQKWLAKVNTTTTFKFVVTSVPFTSLWGHDAATDSWAGYEHEKAHLLELLHSVSNVIFLSGDRHEFADIEFTHADAASHAIREFSTSPLSMFYVPFFRTLHPESKRSVTKVRTGLLHPETPELPLEPELVPAERVLKYIAAGNHKWSTFEVDTRDVNNPLVRVQVLIDGTVAYETTVVGTPVKRYQTTTLENFVPQGLQDVLRKLGVASSSWF